MRYTGEHRQHAVAGGIDHPAVLGGNVGAEDIAIGIKSGDRCPLIIAHQRRVASDIGGQDRREFLFDRVVRQVVPQSAGMLRHIKCGR